MNISEIEKTLYYQYLINNNSTSTMLNALSGTDTDNGISGIFGSQAGTDAIGSFSNILSSYLSSLGTSSVGSANDEEFVGEIQEVLESAKSESDTLSYKKLQDIYNYMSSKTSANSAISGLLSGENTEGNDAKVVNTIGTGISASDMENIEDETDELIESIFEDETSF